MSMHNRWRCNVSDYVGLRYGGMYYPQTILRMYLGFYSEVLGKELYYTKRNFTEIIDNSYRPDQIGDTDEDV